MARTRITIVLELDGQTDCPMGFARIPDGSAREFHGWLGLAEAIDSLVQTFDPHRLGSSRSCGEHLTPPERSTT